MQDLFKICKETFNGIVVNEDAVLLAAKGNAAELLSENSSYLKLIEKSRETEQVEDFFSGETETVRTQASEKALSKSEEMLSKKAYDLYRKAKNDFYGHVFETDADPVDGLNEQTFA